MDSVLGAYEEIAEQRTCEVRHRRSSSAGLSSSGRLSASEASESQPLISKEEWDDQYGSLEDGYDEDVLDRKEQSLEGGLQEDCNLCSKSSKESFLAEIPAIVVTLMVNFMVAIPFGVVYFPLGWTNDPSAASSGEDDDLTGPFPFPGKEAMGIRMFLFATLTSQLVLTYTSKFANPVSCQLVENVPFYHAMAQIVIAEQGYGKDALSTLFFLFGLSTVVTGYMFLCLGKFGMGRVVYYFPSHVLLGFIGGIGVFVGFSSVSVMTGEDFTFTLEGFRSLATNFEQFLPAVGFEILLRVLMVILRDENGKARFSLLAPIYFCCVVPAFYAVLLIFRIDMHQAADAGYFFPSQMESCDDNIISEAADCVPSSSFWNSVFDGHILDIFRVIDFRLISWTAVINSMGTVISMACFSMIHAPINIPAFANSSNVDVDMDAELIANGYSNILCGLFGGIQNVMTYSVSVLFYKSGGKSRAALLSLVAGLVVVFVFGVSIMPYIPRCMAGTVLLHIGIDLFLEGVYDSRGEYDMIEYIGIWSITVVMSLFGMTAALMAGIVAAMTTYAVQSVQHMDPIFKITTASTLRSSIWTRPPEALAVLDSPDSGRSRIMVIQLHGNLFFGNTIELTETIKNALAKEKFLVVIIDFSLVVSMDSSAAHTVNKLKSTIHQLFQVETNIFVMGSHRGYFPCEYELSSALSGAEVSADYKFSARRWRENNLLNYIPKNRVCVDFDEALIFAEDVLIALKDPSLLRIQNGLVHLRKANEELSEEEEKNLAARFLQNIVPGDHFSPVESVPRQPLIRQVGQETPPKMIDRQSSSMLSSIPGSNMLTQENNDHLNSDFAQNLRLSQQSDDSLRFSAEGDDYFQLSKEDIMNLSSMDFSTDYFDGSFSLKGAAYVEREPIRDDIVIFLSYFEREVYRKNDFVWKQGSESNSAKLVVSGSFFASTEGTDVREEIPRGSVIGELGLVDGMKRLNNVICESDSAVVFSLNRDAWERIVKNNPAVARILDQIAIRYLSHRVQHVSNRVFETRCLPI